MLSDVRLALGLDEVRRELDYLRNLGLAELAGEDGGTWYAKMTARGVDVVEYTVEAPPGVARPRKYW